MYTIGLWKKQAGYVYLFQSQRQRVDPFVLPILQKMQLFHVLVYPQLAKGPARLIR